MPMSKLGGYSILLGLLSWASSWLFAIGPLVVTCTRYPHGRVPEMYTLVTTVSSDVFSKDQIAAINHYATESSNLSYAAMLDVIKAGKNTPDNFVNASLPSRNPNMAPPGSLVAPQGTPMRPFQDSQQIGRASCRERV